MSLADYNNNPGNLRPPKGVTYDGQIGVDDKGFAIFENNDERLWGNINGTITSFLNEYRNEGGLRGVTPSQAFFVKCDAENNPASSIANGEVHIQVGVALQYPAEFIVIDLSQKTLN